MAKRFNCECGFVVNGRDDAELLANAHAHMAEAHPDVADEIRDSDLLESAEEV
ncbi:MAG: DUF1059 domain-containing protein [Actinomycetota bacterium]|nr:DUF1059 domain-containing protein [Actinomycetota bacterium]